MCPLSRCDPHLTCESVRTHQRNTLSKARRAVLRLHKISEVDAVCHTSRCDAPRGCPKHRLSDDQLMELVKKGDHDAFSDLFDRYHRLVLSIALRILRDASEAEDTTQEVFFAIYLKARSYDSARGTAKGWISGHAHHRSVNRLHYLSARRFYDTVKATETMHRPRLWNGVTAQEWAAVLQRGLAELNHKQRMTVEMVCYDGHSVAEVARTMNETVGNVRNHYYRGLERLRRYLRERACL